VCFQVLLWHVFQVWLLAGCIPIAASVLCSAGLQVLEAQGRRVPRAERPVPPAG
jgi:hypothetical protein